MSSSDEFSFSVMTYNIGGAKQPNYSFDKVLDVVHKTSPDILGIQEISERVDLDGQWVRQPEMVAAALGDSRGFSYQYYFGPAISMREQFNARKDLFVDGLFSDWQDWWQGNAIFSRWDFLRLGNSKAAGQPQNIPIYRPPTYEGSRDTDPRYLIITRVDCGPVQPYVLVTHLTTVAGERKPGNEFKPLREKGQSLRLEQCLRILDLLYRHVLARGEMAILLGDFNASPSEASIANVLEEQGGFQRLSPANGGRTIGETSEPVDYIFLHPGRYQLDFDCEVIDDGEAHTASDHFPILAKIKFKK